MPTTVADTVRHLREMERVRLTRARARADGLRALLGEAASTLRAEGASEVWLFGSLATGDVHDESDVDLAVRGLPAAARARALTALMRLFPCGVDLVRLEDAPESLRARVDAEGIQL